MDWDALFAVGEQAELSTAEISDRLEAIREDRPHSTPTATVDEPVEPTPVRIVVDADVLVADLFGTSQAARTALDTLWEHSWITLVGSDELLTDAAQIITAETDETIAAGWRSIMEEWRLPVTHPKTDHPALGSAYRGGAMHILSNDERLTGSRAATALQGRLPVSVRTPDAFNAVFSAASLYQEVSETPYDGPDRKPRRRR